MAIPDSAVSLGAGPYRAQVFRTILDLNDASVLLRPTWDAAGPLLRVSAPKAAAPAGDGTQVTAPMNGTIARVNCKVGDTVKADAAVIILEAMKMENEIYAGVDGTVKAVQVNTGDAVQPGDVLVVIG